MQISRLTIDSGFEWNHYLKHSELATPYHLVEWRDIITNQFGHETYYLYSRTSQNNISGVLPLIRLKSLVFGDYMVSMPYFNYGNTVADSEEIESALMHEACELGKSLDISHIEFRDTKYRNTQLHSRTDKVAMILKLPETEDQLWQLLGSKRRAQIKRPLKEGPDIFHGGIELLDDFYRVFSINMRDLGTPVYPKSFFREILEVFPDMCHLVVIKLDNIAVSCAFLIGYRNTMEIPWASTVQAVNPTGMNMLLYWEVLKYSINNKYNNFDFGRSSINSGTHRFKKQWGAKPRQLYWYYWLNNSHKMPGLTPDNPKYKYAIAIWKKLPVTVTNFLGPHIVKNLP